MARLDFTALTQNLSAVTASIKEVMATLFADANAQRKELIDLHARMADNRADLSEVAQVAYDIADVFVHIGADCEDVCEKAKDALETGEVPSVDYEEFVGWCEDCGAEVVEGTDYSLLVDENALICAACSCTDKADPAPTDEATE